MDFGHTYRADCSMRSFGHELRNPGLGFQSVIGYFHAFSVHCFSTRGAWFRRAVIKNTGTRKLPCFQRAREVCIHPPDSKRWIGRTRCRIFPGDLYASLRNSDKE